MKRLMPLLRIVAIAAIVLASVAVTRRAAADVTLLVLGSRTCGTITAYAIYDSFSEGNPPFYAVFAADLNGNGIYGEAGEPIRYTLVGPGGAAGYVRGYLNFRALPTGSSIAVTAYEIDSDGTQVSPQLSAVRYTCAHRPATDALPANTGFVIPGTAVTAKITASSVLMYSAPNASSSVLGGITQGAILNVIARTVRGDWVEVRSGGQTGWIMWVTNAILLGPYRRLPIVTG